MVITRAPRHTTHYTHCPVQNLVEKIILPRNRGAAALHRRSTLPQPTPQPNVPTCLPLEEAHVLQFQCLRSHRHRALLQPLCSSSSSSGGTGTGSCGVSGSHPHSPATGHSANGSCSVGMQPSPQHDCPSGQQSSPGPTGPGSGPGGGGRGLPSASQQVPSSTARQVVAAATSAVAQNPGSVGPPLHRQKGSSSVQHSANCMHACVI